MLSIRSTVRLDIAIAGLAPTVAFTGAVLLGVPYRRPALAQQLPTGDPAMLHAVAH